MGMTTLLSSKLNSDRGSCSRTLVSRTKFFFKAGELSLEGGGGGVSSLPVPSIGMKPTLPGAFRPPPRLAGATPGPTGERAAAASSPKGSDGAGSRGRRRSGGATAGEAPSGAGAYRSPAPAPHRAGRSSPPGSMSPVRHLGGRTPAPAPRRGATAGGAAARH